MASFRVESFQPQHCFGVSTMHAVRPSGWIRHNRKLPAQEQAHPMPTVAPDRRSIGTITTKPFPGARREAMARAHNAAWRRSLRIFGADGSRYYADTPANRVLSELGQLQDEHLRYVRSLKRAETLLDAILAPCIRAALAEDYAAPIFTRLEPWHQWLNNGKRPTAKPEVASAPVHKPRKRRRKLPRKPSAPLCGPHHADVRHDALDAARYFVAVDYPERCAQANARKYRLTLAQWRAMAESRDLRESAPMPADDDAASVIERHWSDCVEHPDTLPETLPLTRPRRSYAGETSAPEAIPLAIDGITDADGLVAAMLIDGASVRDIIAHFADGGKNGAAQRKAYASIERIRARVKDWKPPQDDTPPAHRRAILADAAIRLGE